jgi:hypothetical protein
LHSCSVAKLALRKVLADIEQRRNAALGLSGI